jgi:predicted O-methyltransferase YrrM
VGSLLRTLAASKPGGRFLDLGTGTGLSAAWLLDGMGPDAALLSMDNDPAVLEVARRHLGHDRRLQLVCEDGDTFVQRLAAEGRKFDLIFADTWAGKYRCLQEVLGMLNPAGFYVIDDMLPQPNWPEDHPPKVQALIKYLEAREDLRITKMAWSCGVVLCTKV